MAFIHIFTTFFVFLFAAALGDDVVYELMPYGFASCNAKFGSLYTDVSEANMVKSARDAGADGFAYHSGLRYGYILTAPYNRACQSSSNSSWPLYLSKIPYTKMPYGFNACPTNFGPLRTGVSEADMALEASANGYDGYSYHSSLKYGRVLTKPYDRSCQSPENQSWPLFLKTIVYKKVPYGFNGCDAKFTPNRNGVTEEEMARLANEAGADGFAYHPSLKSGAVLTAPYDRSCQSPPNQSWPLYLKSE